MCRTAQGLVWLRWSERETVRNEDPDVEGTRPCGVLQDIVRLDRKSRKLLEGSESRSHTEVSIWKQMVTSGGLMKKNLDFLRRYFIMVYKLSLFYKKFFSSDQNFFFYSVFLLSVNKSRPFLNFWLCFF